MLRDTSDHFEFFYKYSTWPFRTSRVSRRSRVSRVYGVLRAPRRLRKSARRAVVPD